MRPIAPRTLLLLAGIVALNVAWQSRGFFVAHVTGDQRLYIGLAMKLSDQGFAGYSLHQINVRPADGFVEFREADGDDVTGDLLRALKESGTTFYDQPLFHTPPLFPGMLAISHRMFGGGDSFVVLGRSHEPTATPGRQFYACVVPVVSSVLLVIGTFAIGRRLFSEEVGLIGAFLLTITPIQILAGQHVWAEATLAALVTWAVWLSVRGNKLAGLCFALALLTKITAALTIPAFLCVAWPYRQKWKSQAVFWVVVVLVTLPWYVTVWRTFGTPFFAPHQPGISQTQEWFALINRQPWWTYLVGVPLQLPVFVLGYAGAIWGLTRWKRGRGEAMLAIWFVAWIAGLTVLTSRDEMLGPEHRYLLPALPALALLTAQGISTARTVLRERFSALVANAVVAAVLLRSAGWALLIAWQSRGFDEIVLPF
jgi:hypothetical protein